MEDAEHRHRDTDADGEDERHGTGDEALATEQAQTQSRIAADGREPVQRTDVAAFVLGEIQRAELQMRPPARLVGGQPLSEVVIDLALQMIAELGVEGRLCRPPAPWRAELHDALSAAEARRIPPMADVSRLQLARSCSRAARPFFVRR